jgi:hypothetical protein
MMHVAVHCVLGKPWPVKRAAPPTRVPDSTSVQGRAVGARKMLCLVLAVMSPNMRCSRPWAMLESGT